MSTINVPASIAAHNAFVNLCEDGFSYDEAMALAGHVAAEEMRDLAETFPPQEPEPPRQLTPEAVANGNQCLIDELTNKSELSRAQMVLLAQLLDVDCDLPRAPYTNVFGHPRYPKSMVRGFVNAAPQRREAEIKALMALPKLKREQFERLAKLLNLSGELPPPSQRGKKSGEPRWTKEDFQRWAGSEAIHTRSATAHLMEYTRRATDPRAPGAATRAAVRPNSYDEAARTWEMVVASETPVPQYDFLGGGIVLEILVAGGGEFPSQFPVQADHDRSIFKTIGQATGATREGTQWVATGRHGADPTSMEVGAKIRDGIATACSIGYQLREYYDLPPGASETIGGRFYENNYDHPMRIVTRWKVNEVSIVSVPADPSCVIRADQETRSMPATPAIHSRNSVTHQPTVGELVSAALMSAGVSDPTQCRYAVDPLKGHYVRQEPSTRIHRDADGAIALRNRPWAELALRAAELDGLRIPRETPGEFVDVLNHLRLHVQGQSRFSTANINAWFADSVNSLALSMWDTKGDSTRGWCDETDIKSTRSTSNLTLSAAPQLTKAPRGGQADGTTFDLTYETNRLTRYGVEFKVDEQDWIDGAAVADIVKVMLKQLMNAARALRPSLVYSILRRNPVMGDGERLFSTAHGNLKYSAALGDDKLGAAMAAMAAQTDGDAKLNLRAQYIVAPGAIERAAAKLIREMELSDPEAMRAPVLKTDARLDEGFTCPETDETFAGDLTTWFMAAAGGAHGIQVAYREGDGRQPLSRISWLTEGYFGASIDVQYYLGVGIVDQQGRGLVMNVAAAES